MEQVFYSDLCFKQISASKNIKAVQQSISIIFTLEVKFN